MLKSIALSVYSDVYSSVDPESDPVLSRVNDIYNNLVSTIGTQQAVRSKLMIISGKGYPWAVALGDNTVVLTTGSVKRMYRENDMVLGDARAAFVLGHELSHLATDDLFHHRYFLFNRGSTQQRPAARPDDELRADLRGYTIATLAGYQTDLLLDQERDFFRTWLSQISDNDSPTHPGIETRRQYLQEGFEQILNDVPYYRFAVALAHFGYYKDAEILLEDSLNRVETMEAYSNLGYVYLQTAREKMPENMAYRYWFPTLLEPRNTLKLRQNRSIFANDMPEQAMRYLKKAERRLKYAISLDEDHLPNHINLATVYLYMPNKIHRAYASIEDARLTPLGKHPAVRAQLESIYQLIRVRDDLDDADRWPHARDTMMRLANSKGAAENLLFNFARMLDERGRDNTATQYWERLYDRIETLPPSYQSQVCVRLSKGNCRTSARESSPWNTDRIPLGKDIRLPEIRSYLQKNWGSRLIPSKTLPNLQAQVMINDQGNSLIALDNQIEMMILRDIPSQYSTLSALQRQFGLPEVALPVASGHLLSFRDGWSAYLQDNEVREIWIAEL